MINCIFKRDDVPINVNYMIQAWDTEDIWRHRRAISDAIADEIYKNGKRRKRMEGITIKPVRWEIRKDNKRIVYLETAANGRMRLLTEENKQEFIFNTSTPETVEEIANLMLRAAKLAREVSGIKELPAKD